MTTLLATLLFAGFVSVLAAADSIEAAALGALVAGVFTLFNTYLNSRILGTTRETVVLLARVHEQARELSVLLQQRRVSVRDLTSDRNIVAYEPVIKRDIRAIGDNDA